MKQKVLVLIASCAILLSGCTKSNIVNPDNPVEPDFNLYNNIELDEDQIRDELDEIYLDTGDYPMASAINFEFHLEESYITIDVVVKDGTSPDDAAWFADQAIKGINDLAADQDFTYGLSDEDTFGGLYQDNEIQLKIYNESSYSSKSAPMYETTIPMDTYISFEIAS